MSSSLSSVVSNLVRASMGTSISSMVTDNDLDRHVAELIVKEAKKKAERYGQQGIRAYISSNLSENNVPRTNKRFLTSIIKSTDDHNKTVLRAQAAAAQEVKREREEQERRERRARAAEAAEAEKLRRRSKRKRDPEDESWDRWDGRTADRKRTSSSRIWENWSGYDDDNYRSGHKRRSTNDRSRSRSRERGGDTSSRSSHTKLDSSSSKRHRTHRSRSRSASLPRKASRDKSFDREEDDDDSRSSNRRRSRVDRRKRRRSPSRSRSPSPHKSRKRCRSPKYALNDLRDESLSSRSCSTALGPERRPRERRYSTPSTSRSYPVPGRDNEASDKYIDPISSASRHSSPSSRVPSRLSSPGLEPQPPVQLPSKMDRYFEESYDPRLDVAPLSAPKVPATGLINNAEFEGWDAMLELIRVRREDKEEKKRLERLGLSKEKVKVKKSVPISSSAAVADRWSSEGVSILDIEYKKRGSVREWDLGKEGF